MKKTFIITLLAMALSTAFAQNGEKAITFSVGFAYHQIWLQSNCYGTNEYGAVSSSPFNWGVSPFFSMRKNRWEFGFSCSYLSFSRTQKYSETHFSIDKWQEANLASTVGFRVTGERQLINVTPFLGIDLSYLINYEKDVTMGTSTRHYNTDELEARNYHDIYVWNVIPFPFGLDILGGY